MGLWRQSLLLASLGAATWTYAGWVLILRLDNTLAIPFWLGLGTFVVPGVIMVQMCRRSIRPGDPPGRALVISALVGGIAALLIGGTLDSIDEDVFGYSTALLLAAVVEEGAKATVAVIIARGQGALTFRAGLYIGGAVGIGYAALENLGYAMAPFLGQSFGDREVHASTTEQLLRAAILPLGHPLWTGVITGTILVDRLAARWSSRWWGATICAAMVINHAVWDGALREIVATLYPDRATSHGFATLAGLVVVLSVTLTVGMWGLGLARSRPRVKSVTGA